MAPQPHGFSMLIFQTQRWTDFFVDDIRNQLGLTRTLNSVQIPVMKPSTWPIGSLVAFSHTAGLPLRAWRLPTSILPQTLAEKNIFDINTLNTTEATGSAPSPMLCYRQFHLGCLLAFSYCRPRGSRVTILPQTAVEKNFFPSSEI